MFTYNLFISTEKYDMSCTSAKHTHLVHYNMQNKRASSCKLVTIFYNLLELNQLGLFSFQIW